MSINVDSGSGILRTTVVQANPSEQTRFGVLDGTVITFFLLCVAGLIYLVVQ